MSCSLGQIGAAELRVPGGVGVFFCRDLALRLGTGTSQGGVAAPLELLLD
jgi:hypothetical protein